MRLSRLFSQTLYEAPTEAETNSHRLLLRAGYIRQLASGIFSYLPLAKRALTKIENIMRDELNAIGGQEVTMPVVNPAEIWQETGRWQQIGSEMGRFKDKSQRDMVLAMTHEEVVSDLVRKEIHSYRQLPALIYHIQTKWRDDPRPRAGLIRAREFTMKDSYSLDASWEGLDKQYRNHYQAYFNIFHRCDLPVIAVKSDVGMMGGTLAHEYMVLSPMGEDTIVICSSCGYSANQQIARFQKTKPAERKLLPISKVATPGTRTIELLTKLLNIPKSKTAKAILLMATYSHEKEPQNKFVFAVVRGDMDINETKLANAIQAKELRPALEEEILAVGAVPGYASPIGIKNALVVIDDSIPHSTNLVAGANQEGYHLLNTNYPRDYKADVIADIAKADLDSLCPNCTQPLYLQRGVEVGNIFKLGTRYSEKMGCFYRDQEGNSKPVIMGSYGIGTGRLLACIAETHNDEKGLALPITIAPYQVHLVTISGKNTTQPENVSEELYTRLTQAGLEILYDDRHESPGVKFNDADLIGLPIRLTISERSLKEGGVELKLRHSYKQEIIPKPDILTKVKTKIQVLEQQINQKVVAIEYKE